MVKLFFMTFIDMARWTKLRVVSKTSCTGHDKSNDKTESCKKQSVAQRLELVKFTDDTYWSLSNDTSSN